MPAALVRHRPTAYDNLLGPAAEEFECTDCIDRCTCVATCETKKVECPAFDVGWPIKSRVGQPEHGSALQRHLPRKMRVDERA